MRQQLLELLEPIIIDAGFELVELEYLREQGWTVRLFIERLDLPVDKEIGIAPGHGVTLDECSEISRQVSAVLDVEDVIPHRYTLQVSSPGVQRPLRKKSDFERFLECRVRIKTFDLIAPQEATEKSPKPGKNLLGVLAEVGENSITIEVQGNRFLVPMDKIARAHLDPDMELWMKHAKQARDDRGE